MITLDRKNYQIKIEEPTIYVDNEARGCSGHMTHALAAFSDTEFVDFNSNCSMKRYEGHSAFGWVEYRTSTDSGKTYSDVSVLPVSKEFFYDGINTVSVEKAIAFKNGKLVALCLRNCQTDPCCCEPWDTPYFVTSFDKGKSWSQPSELAPFKGRIYDAVYHNGTAYVVLFCNEHFLGETEEHKYRIYTCTDNEDTFSELCVIPFDTKGRGYASLLFDNENNLHAFAYNVNAETELDHAVSCDFGKTWEVLKPCHLEKGIRNPQTALIDGVFVIHGRNAAGNGLVLYTSEDLENFDEGAYIVQKDHKAAAYYSNNLNLKDENGEFLLIQYSDTYLNSLFNLEHWVATVNVMHTKLRIKKNKMKPL